MGHPPRIPVWLRWDQEVAYFVTFCVQGRHKVLDNPKAFTAFQKAIAKLEHWRIIAGLLMPDHRAVLAAPTDDREARVGNLSAALKRWIRQELKASWHWQPGSFDRLLRSEDSAQDKWLYIRENPARAGLVTRSEEWPYQIGFDQST